MAGENKSNALAKFFDDEGIEHSSGTAYDHAQKSVIERANRTIWEGSEAMRFTAGLAPKYWPLCVDAFVHTKNLLPNSMAKQDDDRTPDGRWNNHAKADFKRSIAHHRVFECKAYAFIHKEVSKRLDYKTVSGVLLD